MQKKISPAQRDGLNSNECEMLQAKEALAGMGEFGSN
jgi:hypothetical protein